MSISLDKNNWSLNSPGGSYHSLSKVKNFDVIWQKDYGQQIEIKKQPHVLKSLQGEDLKTVVWATNWEEVQHLGRNIKDPTRLTFQEVCRCSKSSTVHNMETGADLE